MTGKLKRNLRSIDLNLLTVFDAIMTEGKLSKAGERLGMTQPAVSGALARLRLTFGDELFLRTRHGMLPTPRAQSLIKPIREALNLIVESIELLEEFDPETSTRRFVVSTGDLGELILMPALLRLIEKQSPKIEVESRADSTQMNVELLKQGVLDVYFDYLVPEDPQLAFHKIAEDFPVVIARQSHPRIENKISMESYLSERHIILSHRHKQKTILEELLGVKALPRKILAEVQQYTAMPEIVAQTDALAVIPQGMAVYYARLLPIKIIPFPGKLNKLGAYMIWNKAFDRDVGNKWLREQVLKLVSASAVQSEQ